MAEPRTHAAAPDATRAADAPQVVAIGRRVFRDEIAALEKVSESIGAEFEQAVELILACRGRLIVTGLGKSGIVAKKIAATFTSTGTPSFYIHPVEAAHGDLGLVGAEDLVLAISKSGSNEELTQLLPVFENIGVAIIAVTGDRGSRLAERSRVVLHVDVREEAGSFGPAPTSSTTAALVMGDALALALAERKNFRLEDFAGYHPSGILGKRLTLRVRHLMSKGDSVPLVPEGVTLREALPEMVEKRLGCVGVVNGRGRLTGILTDGDLKRVLFRNPRALDGPMETIMTRDPRTIGPDALATEALGTMELNRPGPITMLYVVERDGQPIGVIHIHDILRAGLRAE
jgi:arabinose-5-phosphate isomerase